MLQLQTLNDIFFALDASRRDQALLVRQESGSRHESGSRQASSPWQPISSDEFCRRIRAVASTLLDWGIRKGDRVAILAENRWEWATADFACLALGIIDVPLYPTLLAHQIQPLLADSASRVLFVSTRAQYDKVAPILPATAVERVVLMDSGSVPESIPESVPVTVTFSSLIENTRPAIDRATAIDQAARAVQPSDLATLIYTSGTTGDPKGVLLTHGNIATNINYSTAEFGFTSADSCISFLPLSHITARHVDYALYAQNVTVAFCPAFDQLPQTLLDIRPTIFVAVPRVYEKVRQVAEQRASESPVKRRLLALALSTGSKHRDAIAAGRRPASPLWSLFDRLAYSKIRAGFGGRVRYFIAGGAPLGLDTAHWFASAGIRILEGYGLTETSPVLAINTPNANRMGSVGKPLPNIECSIAPDGELLVRGPSVFSGYWLERGNAEAFDAGRWFHTGDIGHIDPDGFLFITDRKKELLKTSGGKFIAPQPIENKLKGSFLVANVAVVGDRHKFASALIAPNFAALESWAGNRGIACASRIQLLADPRVRAEYQALIDAANATLANFETIKRFRIVPDEWAIDSGELTPSMKLRRRVIAQKYAAEIAEFYADESVSHR